MFAILLGKPVASSLNQVLSNARTAKQDEFYTQLSDISNELKHYKTQLRGKTILCNCDDPFESNFFKYFALNFNTLGLKKLIATSYMKSPIAGAYLPLFDIEGLKPEGEEPYAIEINEVPDHNRDGAIDLADGSPRFFHNLTAERQKQILDYKLSVYVCDGSDGEKLDWFKIINIAGLKLTDQELRNAIFTGPWLTDAKRWFSKSGAPAVAIGSHLLNGAPLRQEYLETALDWLSKGAIEQYMAEHQHDADAQELWQYFQSVVAWVERTFPNYRRVMKGLSWGRFYNAHKDDVLNAAKLESRIKELIEDDEVDNKKGIYEFLLTGDEKTLNLRTFDEKTKFTIYEKQKGICPVCKKHFADISAMEADHIIPWSKGGKTTPDNCQMLCKIDNRTKGGK